MALDPVKRRGMIKNFVTELKREGATITHSTMEGSEQPYKIGQYKPDVIGTIQQRGFIGIVRGGGEFETGPGRQEIKYFTTRISQKTRREVPLYIAVPKENHNDLVRVLKELGLGSKSHIKTRAY